MDDRFDARENAYGWCVRDSKTLEFVREELSQQEAENIAREWNTAWAYFQAQCAQEAPCTQR